jgi:hypothetical protein
MPRRNGRPQVKKGRSQAVSGSDLVPGRPLTASIVEHAEHAGVGTELGQIQSGATRPVVLD